MRVAVVGHVEWLTFARVARVPSAGEIVHADASWEEPAGGGAVVAVQLRKLAGACTFFTAFGSDDLGRRARSELEAMGLRVEAAERDTPQRRAFTFLDDAGERTITVMGERLGPCASDPLDWSSLDETDVAVFTAGDDDALRMARRARLLVATSREFERLKRVGVRLDAIAGSGGDPAERFDPDDVEAALWVRTDGARGGDSSAGRFGAAPPPGPVVDAYGAGDSFLAGLAFALARGDAAPDAIAFAARCGAACTTGRGPYEGQLTG